MIAVCLFLGVVVTALTEEIYPITFKMVDDYEFIWNDAGSGAHREGSYWRPKGLAYDFFPLGDFVHDSYSKPTTKSVLVKANDRWALTQPAFFSTRWDDAGSGADMDVRVWSMFPNQGYTCLGEVAVASYSETPDVTKYRCVRTEYVAVGSLTEIWNDAYSGAVKDISSWRVVRGTDMNVEEAGTFISVQAYSKPTETPHLLNSDYAHEIIMKTKLNRQERSSYDDFPIKLYKTSDIQQIWNDLGSGAKADFSCSRPRGPGETFSLGDMPLNNYGVPMYGIVAKSVEDGALQEPYDYREIWNDEKSGADRNGAFWEPLCHGGYAAVGSVCTASYSKPSINEVRCVKKEHVATGQWVKIWSDAGSGASKDVTVFQAEADGPNEQGLEAMGAVQQYSASTMPSDKPPYLLIGDHTIMIDGKPATGYYLTNVQYDLDQTEILSQDPAYLATTTVENHGNTTQTSTRTLSSEWSESRDWSYMTGIESGVETTTEAGVPLFAKASVTVGIVGTFEYQSGGSVTETMTDSIAAEITVLPHCQKTVDMVGVNYVADIPFTADVRTEYADGTTGFRYSVEGIYYGTNVGDRRVIYGPDLPIE